jgi:5-methylcytosine-specific restriction endonuclease McrA
MIKLGRQRLRPELEARMRDRAGQLRESLANGADPPDAVLNAYRDPELKQHLIAEAHGKCIYCESKVTHVYYGDVEHIKPKAVFPDERLNIENLALACAICNGAKGDFWDEDVPLLNPYRDDPNDELMALGYLVARRPGRNRARITIGKLQLNRPALLERRRERVELLQALADQYAQAPNGPVKDLLRAELCSQASDAAEYAFTVRAYLEAACELRCL